MKRTIIIAAVLFAIVLLAGAAYTGWLVWHRFNLPLFAFAQQPSADGLLTDSFLSSGSTRYVMSKPEYSLQPVPAFFGGPLIGRTTNGQEIRAVPGSDDYVSLSGFMDPISVYRKESAPPVDLATLPVEEIRYVAKDETRNIRKSTRDAQLIAEIVRALQAAPVSLPQNSRVYHAELLSPDLPGLIYSFYVVIDYSGRASFAPMYDVQHGAPAGPLFTEWINQN